MVWGTPHKYSYGHTQEDRQSHTHTPRVYKCPHHRNRANALRPLSLDREAHPDPTCTHQRFRDSKCACTNACRHRCVHTHTHTHVSPTKEFHKSTKIDTEPRIHTHDQKTTPRHAEEARDTGNHTHIHRNTRASSEASRNCL